MDGTSRSGEHTRHTAWGRPSAWLRPLWEPMRTPGTLASQIASHVQDLIATGELRPGDRLPGERELADLLAVGRSSVREAVQSLAALGLVSVRHGHGVFVAPAPGEHQPAATGTDTRWIDEFYAMRETLEAPAARWAACNATPQTIIDLEETYSGGGRRHQSLPAGGTLAAERRLPRGHH